MNTKEKTLLKSKLSVYKLCYRRAEEREDHDCMEKAEAAMDELREEIRSLA
jgi:hypothetical protein